MLYWFDLMTLEWLCGIGVHMNRIRVRSLMIVNIASRHTRSSSALRHYSILIVVFRKKIRFDYPIKGMTSDQAKQQY